MDALLLGSMLHLSQSFFAFTAPTEPRLIRSLVMCLVLFSTAVSIYNLVTVMLQFVYRFGDYSASVYYANTRQSPGGSQLG